MHLLAHVTFAEVFFVVAIYVAGVGSGLLIASRRWLAQEERSQKER